MVACMISCLNEHAKQLVSDITTQSTTQQPKMFGDRELFVKYLN